MKLSLDSLNEIGAFTGAPVKKEISWKIDGKEFTADVYVRRLSYHSAVGEIEAYRAGKDGMAGRIAACIVDETGKPILTVGDITGDADPKRGPLDKDLTMALLAVIGEVNSLGKSKSSQD